MPTALTPRAALLAMALCLLSEAAAAQAAPVQYWLPGGAFGLSGNWMDAGATRYGNFPAFDAASAGDDWKANFKTGAFLRSEAASLSRTGLGWASGVSDFGGLAVQSTQAGYAFKGVGDLPVSVYAGFDSLNYRPGIGTALAPFSADASMAAGYSARAGIAFQPAANLTLSFEAGITQQQTDVDPTTRLLSGQGPLLSGRR